MEDWNPNDSGAFIQCAGGIYEKIKIPAVCLTIIDTPAFQRLNNIKQLGVVDRIFRQAVHTRFEHSLGVADLARKVIKRLKKKSTDITGNDVLCVIIAALCHDLGHGPFSHSLDPIMYELNENFSHRRLSVQIFNYILDNEKDVKETLSKYLTDEDFEFIREIIHPPENFFVNGQWMLKGRPASKQYLYEIVNNVNHGVDIDKLDYIARDSHRTGIDVAVGPHFISRFINGIEIQNIDGEQRLTFDGKLADDIPDVFSSRKLLYSKVYFHKKVYPLEYQVHKAIRLAGPHLKFRGANGELKTVKEILTQPIDIEAYIKLDDHILSLIKHSEIDHPDMHEAKKCIERMERRELHTVILRIVVHDIARTEFIEREVEKRIQMIKNVTPMLKEEGQIISKVRHYDFGKGVHVDPSNKIIYRSRANMEEDMKRTSSGNLRSESVIFVYGPYGMTFSEAGSFYRSMETHLNDQGITEGLEFIFKGSRS